MIVAILVISLGLVPGLIAYKKGYNFFLWWLLGSCLCILVLPITIFLPSKKRADGSRQIAGSLGYAIGGTAVMLVFAGIISNAAKQNDGQPVNPPIEDQTAQTAPVEDRTAQAAQVTNEAKASTSIPRPDDETQFVEAMAKYAAQYNAGSNDLVKGAARPARAEAICQLRQDTAVTDWTGTVETLSSSSDGKGVLAVRLSRHLTVATTNNQFSDSIGMRTLIRPGTDVFRAATQLHEGQTIRFSGTFASKEDDCFEESSLTQEGSMTDPEFLFRFTSIDPL